MNQPTEINPAATGETEALAPEAVPGTEAIGAKPQPSYVKLAMRNMVRKRGTSIYHFALTTIGLLTALIGLAYLTR